MMLQTDYLVVGCGAVGMAFVDTLLEETDANIIIVDRNAKPGGHWNVAYPFVTLHQPSQFYGVSSRELSNHKKDETGLNKGLYSLATGAEVSAYFDRVMQETFISSGRVQYFPMCDYKGDHTFESMVTGKKFEVQVNKKLVDCTLLNTSVPATHTPNFTVADGLTFIPLNDLPKIQTPPSGFVVIGGGKTGMDACLWLLENEVNPDDITWIVSRDAWLTNRKTTQPAEEFFEESIGNMAAQMEAIAQAESVSDLYSKLEEAGIFVRLDKSIEPQMFHGATVSELELEELRRIKNVVRLGRVTSIGKDQIILERGSVPASDELVYVDCSASAITNLEIQPIFNGDVISPLTVRSYQPVFSASVIAYVEANYKDDQTKNRICQVVRLPNHVSDWVPMMESQLINQVVWSQEKEFRNWLRGNRLNGFSNLIRSADKNDEKKMAILKKLRDNSMPALIKLQQFMKEMNPTPPIENAQFQVRKDVFVKHRLVEDPTSDKELVEGEVLVKIDRFAYTANNITYAVTGDRIGYWQFFPPKSDDKEGWGVIPVWGFAEVVASKTPEIPIGDRLFGYFSPSKYLKMKPVKVSHGRFIDGAEHRSKLPSGYNLYTRVNNEKGYNPAFDNPRMLLTPLFMTSFFLWDTLKQRSWHDAKQIVVFSASSKTSIGLGYALKADPDAPKVIGVTSQRNLSMVQSLNLYDDCFTYEEIEKVANDMPTTIVDMSGNTRVMGALHKHLGDNMRFTLNVGLTHWTNLQPQKDIIQARSEFFFAPLHIQKRYKEWGPEEFQKKTTAFFMGAAVKAQQWLTYKTLNGLEELSDVHADVCQGTVPANEGLIVKM